MHPSIKIILKSILVLILLLIGLICFSYFCIQLYAKDKSYYSVDEIPYHRVGVVLGTSKSLKSGIPNPFFEYRMDAAAKLYHSGKVDRLVISGDNSEIYYNEPRDMQRALLARGVELEHLYVDFAGFRTLDSILRMKYVFQESQFIVISQKFHNERAIFIASVYGLNVIGFNAQDVSVKDGLKVQIRELLARVKVFIDILVNKKPRFLGEPIPID